MMKIGQAWEKRNWGGPKPTWRKALPFFNGPNAPKGSPIDRTIRVATNRQAKKQRAVFSVGLKHGDL